MLGDDNFRISGFCGRSARGKIPTRWNRETPLGHWAGTKEVLYVT
jgi:hypothetical protein